jgi:hypothetical protein
LNIGQSKGETQIMTQTSLPSVSESGAAVAAAKEKRFDWPLCYETESFVQEQIDAFLARNRFARELAGRMREETGTLMIDWVDYLALPAQSEDASRKVGYTNDPLGETSAGQKALWHPEAMLPRVLVDSTLAQIGFPPVLAIRADSVLDFMAAHRVAREPEGGPLSRLRRLMIAVENGARLEVLERRGYRGYVTARPQAGEVEGLLKAKELWQTRQRMFEDDAAGFAQAHSDLDRVIGLVGRDLACHAVFEGERIYWERRNRAAQIQKTRQDRLGLGWANHDHHTFRSSRKHFLDLMLALEKLGFERRERYYTGAQAGWGAQILEQPVEGIVAFCDVDLEPGETEIDFSRQPLPASKKSGTIGLWVGLHGESFLEAGMHHLECRFDHPLLRDQMAALNIGTMKPFSDLPFLKQAFTDGEGWPVRRERAERLRRNGLIDQEQFNKFTTEGAIGSHLENLQRKGGFKGFNQKSVSVIIQATDPRKQGHDG